MQTVDGNNKRLTKLPWYTEGPVTDEQGNIYCTTLAGGTILKMDVTGTISIWAKTKCPNGQVILNNGDHLVCDSDEAAICRFNVDGKFEKYDITRYCDGKRVHVPNDLVVDRMGGIYFTDSIRHEGQVFYYTTEGFQRRIATHLDYPNGIALSKDGKSLFIAESYRNRIIVINLKSPGITEGDWKVFADLPRHKSGEAAQNLPDGIKIDSKGQIWVAHYGMSAIQVYSEKGSLINSINIDFPLTSNLYLTADELIVTGGYSEPGPGGILIVNQ